MANVKAKTAPKDVETVVIEIPADFEAEMHGHTISAKDFVAMPATGVAHALKLGWSTGMKNQAAMPAEKKQSMSEAELESFIADKRAEYHAAFLKGEVRAGVGGTRATPLERFVTDVTRERLKAHLAKKGAKMPKGEALTAALDKVYKALKDSIDAEAQSRLDKANAESAVLDNVL